MSGQTLFGNQVEPTNLPARKLNRAQYFIFPPLFLFFVYIGRSRLMQDGDTYWHIRVGRQILATLRPVSVDDFTCSFAGQPWISHNWVGQCGLAILDWLAGFDGVLVAAAVLVAGVYAWGAGRLLAKGLHPLATALILAFVFAASAYPLNARSHLITLVLLGAMYSILQAFESGRLTERQLWVWLPGLFILWANCHGGVLGGLGSIGVIISLWLVGFAWFRRPPVSSRAMSIRMVALVGACMLAMIVNPFGVGIAHAWSAILSADLPNLIIEHARLDPRTPEGLFVVILGLIYGFVFASVPMREVRPTWLLPFVWLYLACTRIRHGPLFGIVALLALAEMLPRTRWSTWLRRRGYLSDVTPVETTIPAQFRPLVLSAILPLILLSAGAVHKWSGGDSADPLIARPPADVWPGEHLSALQNYGDRFDDRPSIFNEARYGGFLIYNTRWRVFLDGRCELFGDNFLKKYQRAREDPTILTEWCEKYRFDAALVVSGSSFDHFFARSPDWTLAHSGDQAALYFSTLTAGSLEK